MKLALTFRVAETGLDLDLIREAERLGYDSAWCGEAYGTDAVTPVAWVLAQTSRIKAGTSIMQMAARTPACAAMTAMTLQALSGNRFLCGIGPSGPQVVEGWHGERFGKPLARTREYIAIIRQILERKAPLEHHGEHYRIPYDGPGASGLGRPLRSIIHGDPRLKIYTAAIAPAGLRTSGEVADGVLPFLMSPEKAARSDYVYENTGSLEDLDRFELGLIGQPLLDLGKNIENVRLPRLGGRVSRIIFPLRLAYGVAGARPVLLLDGEVDIGVGIALPAFALEYPSRLAALNSLSLYR